MAANVKYLEVPVITRQDGSIGPDYSKLPEGYDYFTPNLKRGDTVAIVKVVDKDGLKDMATDFQGKKEVAKPLDDKPVRIWQGKTKIAEV